MSKRIRLHERELKRPMDEEGRRALEEAVDRMRERLPIVSKLAWEEEGKTLALRSKMASLLIRMVEERLIVEAELSLAARMMAKKEHVARATRMVEGLADDLGL